MKYAYALAAFLFVTPVMADEEDGTGALFKNILSGAGIISDGKPEIKYRERAPLVLPPNSNGKLALPAPQASASETNAQWPKDNDLEQNKVKPKAITAKRNDNKLSLEQMEEGRTYARPYDPSRDPTKNPAFENKGSLFSKDSPVLKGKDTLEFKGEGERTSLIQPPTGYRTPSKNQPYGSVGQTDYRVKSTDPFDKSTPK
jgi:hypothetical protein